MIRPAYWTDADLHTRLSADVREFYIGLWMEADDAGFVEWDPIRIGADLYPYRRLAWRKGNMAKWVEALGSHVQVFQCGKHLVVPNLTKHQKSSKPIYPNRRAHEKCMAHMGPDGAMGGHVLEGKGKGREGNRRGAPPRAQKENPRRD